MMKKILAVGALMLSIVLTLVGCGEKGEKSISVDGEDTKIEVEVIDDRSDYTLSKTKDGFTINGGVETIDGFLMSTEDAETLQANLYEDSSYTLLAIGDATGFACMTSGKYQHIFRPDGSTMYICLTASESDTNIYAAEECVLFSVSKD